MKTYEQIVSEARQHLEKIHFHKGEIAKLALEVCEIRTGRAEKGSYTSKEFAKDIGVSYASLMDWVRIYKNVCLPVGLENPTSDDFKDATKAYRQVTGKNTAQNNHNPEVFFNKTEDFQEAFLNIASGGETNDVFRHIYYDLRKIKNKVEKLDLSTQDKTLMLNSMTLLDRISDTINDYLSKKRVKFG